MPANPYPTIATNLTTEESNIASSWSQAANELLSQSAPDTIFLEIKFSSAAGAILREFDGTPVTSLALSEQLRLYPQLGGLFNLAMRNKLYP
jgi:hypothetical protein